MMSLLCSSLTMIHLSSLSQPTVPATHILWHSITVSDTVRFLFIRCYFLRWSSGNGHGHLTSPTLQYRVLSTSLQPHQRWLMNGHVPADEPCAVRPQPWGSWTSPPASLCDWPCSSSAGGWKAAACCCGEWAEMLPWVRVSWEKYSGLWSHVQLPL